MLTRRAQREYLKYRPGFLEEWVLKDNELLHACDDLSILRYEVCLLL
jgi:pyrroloquinoline quinone (PQQ) biosynthesis protein C